MKEGRREGRRGRRSEIGVHEQCDMTRMTRFTHTSSSSPASERISSGRLRNDFVFQGRLLGRDECARSGRTGAGRVVLCLWLAAHTPVTGEETFKGVFRYGECTL